MRERFSRLAPEEIGGGLLLVVVLVAVALQPSAIGRIFESPYATPAPGNPARMIVNATATPAPTEQIGTTRVTGPVSPILIVPPRRTVAPDGRTTFIFDRAGQPSGIGSDICTEAARSGQLVVCVPVFSPVFATPMPAPSR